MRTKDPRHWIAQEEGGGKGQLSRVCLDHERLYSSDPISHNGGCFIEVSWRHYCLIITDTPEHSATYHNGTMG